MTLLSSQSSVLAVVVARIGDTLLATPSMRALRNAAGRLTVQAHPNRVDVLQNLEFIDSLGVLTKGRAWLRSAFAAKKYDVAVCYGRDASLLRYCNRMARASVCFDYPELAGVKGDSIMRVPAPEDRSMHAVDERMLLAQAAGARPLSRRLAYVVTDAERQFAQNWVSTHIPGGRRRLVGIQTCSFPTKAHRDWPMQSFIALAVRMVQRDPDVMIILLGDKEAASRAEGFSRVIPNNFMAAAGSLSLRQSAALMQQLSLYVGVDTGPTHIAGALDVPMVALYHPAYPGRNLMPLDRQQCVVIEHPRTGGGDSLGADMGEISVDAVWDAVGRLH